MLSLPLTRLLETYNIYQEQKLYKTCNQFCDIGHDISKQVLNLLYILDKVYSLFQLSFRLS